MLKSAFFMIFKKFEFSTLRKYCVFQIRMGLGKCFSFSIFFVLNRFLPPILGSSFRCCWNFVFFFHTKWPPPTQNPRETLTFGFFTLARSAEVMIFWRSYKALLRLRFVRMSILIGKNRPIQPPNTTAQYNRPLQPPNIATTDESSCTSYFHEKTSSSSLHYRWYS